MRTKWNNLVGRWLVLTLLALFAVPCTACEDVVSQCLSHGAHDAAYAVHAGSPVCAHEACGTPHHQAQPCNCLSDTTKVRHNASVTMTAVPDSDLPRLVFALPEPAPVRAGFAERDHPLPPLLHYSAAAGRAPPAS